MEYAPIILFTYCRPRHTQQTVEALLRNVEAKESDLIIYSDAPKHEKAKKGVEETRAYIRSIKGFKSIQITEREKNWGLAKSLIDGITKVVNQYGRVIVVEDDIVTSPYFLKYMNDGLNLYTNEDKVASICGYMYPIKKKMPETFFIQGADCWGWATWDRAWKVFNPNAKDLLNQLVNRNLQKQFDFDGTYPYVNMLKAQIQEKIDSWAIRWYASTFLNGMYTLYPGQSMVFQNGMDGEGAIHCAATSVFDVNLKMNPIILTETLPIENSIIGFEAFKHFFATKLAGRKVKIIYLVKRFTKRFIHW